MNDVDISHPEKLLFPGDGITKGDVASYYRMIAPCMLPHIRGRPITMERYHRGIEEPGFFQKDVSKGYPDWLERVEVPKKGGTVHHPIVNDVRALLWLANQNCITPHVWASRLPDLRRPDLCLIDLDPSEQDGDDASVRAAALQVRDLFDELGLRSWVKTSGSKGFHIAAPLDAKSSTGAVARFAHAVGIALVARDPEHLTLEFAKADRAGRIFVDTGRNGYSATFAAAYALRPKAGAPVSAPCSWAELESGEVGPRTITLRTMDQRIRQLGDVWSDLLETRQSLRAPIERIKKLLSR